MGKVKAKKMAGLAPVWQPPDVEIGEFVHFWFSRYNAAVPPIAALVAEIGQGRRTLKLALVPPDHAGFRLLEDDIRHVDDPDNSRLLETRDEGEFGVWRHLPLRLSVNEVTRLKILLDMYGAEIDQLQVANLKAETDEDDVG